MRILIIEDEILLQKPLKEVFQGEGFVVDTASDGKKGLHKALLNNYDCIILDLNLPKVDGLKVAEKIRESKKETPIIMTTARSQIYDKLDGFDSGADDYLTKPFDLKELIVRVKNLIRRSSQNKENKLLLNNYEIFPDKNKVIKILNNGKRKDIEFSPKEVSVLEYLLRNKGNIVSTSDLLDHVWGDSIDEFTDTLKTHIKTIRKKIDPEKKIIKTIRGRGYLID